MEILTISCEFDHSSVRRWELSSVGLFPVREAAFFECALQVFAHRKMPSCNNVRKHSLPLFLMWKFMFLQQMISFQIQTTHVCRVSDQKFSFSLFLSSVNDSNMLLVLLYSLLTYPTIIQPCPYLHSVCVFVSVCRLDTHMHIGLMSTRAQ